MSTIKTMKTFTFDEKELEIIQLALQCLVTTVDGKNDIIIPMAEALSKRVREYTEEMFASVHSQGG